jgi:hypothetical protein
VATQKSRNSGILILLDEPVTQAQQTAARRLQECREGAGAPLVSAIPREYPSRIARGSSCIPRTTAVVGRGGRSGRGPSGQRVQRNEGSAWEARGAPQGVAPLPVDLFTTKGLLQPTRQLWSDHALFPLQQPVGRSKRSAARTAASRRSVADPPRTAAWGILRSRLCTRAAMLSPYGFATAQQHYEALLAETRGRGGPTKHTYATGARRAQRPVTSWPRGQNWYAELYYNPDVDDPVVADRGIPDAHGRRSSITTRHQRAAVAAQYCWPKGSCAAGTITASRNQPHTCRDAELVQIMAGDADNFVTNVHVGRAFDSSGAAAGSGADVPRWYGETIGFWDGDVTLLDVEHPGLEGAPQTELSSKLQTIEIYTPNRDGGGNVIGLNHEGDLLRPRSAREPMRIVRNLQRSAASTKAIRSVHRVPPADVPSRRRATPASPGNVVEYEVRDMLRPAVGGDLAGVTHEAGMERPKGADILQLRVRSSLFAATEWRRGSAFSVGTTISAASRGRRPA